MFLVMRTHTVSHASKQVLWQVVSRPFGTRQEADLWCAFCQLDYLDDHPRGVHKFFVIETEFTQRIP